MSKVAVIGAGAAGLMAAGFCGKNSNNVTLFERNKRVARKLLITGKGRCNITNNCTVEQFLKNIPVNNKFLYSSLNSFSIEDTMAFFESIGVSLKTERGNRVFPISDNSTSVVDALFEFVLNNKVNVVYERVIDVRPNQEGDFIVKTSYKEYFFDKVILATGGLSYSSTGSTGDGYVFASSIGHSVVSQRPSLVPLICKEDICARMQGLSLKNVRIKVLEDDRAIYSDFGEMLFTHFGVSGPIILSASAHMRKFESKNYKIIIDLKSAIDEKTLDKRLLSDFSKKTNKDAINSLDDLLPKKMIPVIFDMWKVDRKTKINAITKSQRLGLVHLLKNFEVTPISPCKIQDAIITSGGIDVREIDPKTMQSKKITGLYFAGEIIDVDGYTGGFNLQIAWSTGYLAAQLM